MMNKKSKRLQDRLRQDNVELDSNGLENTNVEINSTDSFLEVGATVIQSNKFLRRNSFNSEDDATVFSVTRTVTPEPFKRRSIVILDTPVLKIPNINIMERLRNLKRDKKAALAKEKAAEASASDSQSITSNQKRFKVVSRNSSPYESHSETDSTQRRKARNSRSKEVEVINNSETCKHCTSKKIQECRNCLFLICSDCNDLFEEISEHSNLLDKRCTQRGFFCYNCLKFGGSVETILTWKEVGGTKRYLLKWNGCSYHNVSWVSTSWLEASSKPKLTNFNKRYLNVLNPPLPSDVILPDWLIPESVLNSKIEGHNSALNSEKNSAKLYIKWYGLPYTGSTWESYSNAPSTLKTQYDHLIERYNTKLRIEAPEPHNGPYIFEEIVSPTFGKDGYELYKYQLNGLNWLYYQWTKGNSSILADEMGLGKTIQIITFLHTLYQRHRVYPFLIVVPKAVIPNWLREFKIWAPDLIVTEFFGDKDSRQVILNNNFFKNGKLLSHVLVTTYEVIGIELSIFNKVKWQVVILDEAQKIKNSTTKAFTKIVKLKALHKVLLTGTPIQNSLTELFALLTCLDPIKFSDEELFLEEYNDLNQETLVKLHEQLKPYILRRTIATAKLDLPAKTEVIVPLSMTVLQKELYKGVLSKNASLLATITSKQITNSHSGQVSTLNNIFMELRKCILHPYLLKNVEDKDPNESQESIHKKLVKASAKLEILSRLLRKLKAQGRRALIFSQFTTMLDILEDFCFGENHSYVRISGDVDSIERQARIDRFNKPDSEIFLFLLSTKAGGVGMNLASADTVIIYDIDFNPQNDIQALARAHRIGQKNRVLVMRLITRDSVEERVLQIAKEKLVLDHLIIGKLGDAEISAVDIESVIRFGAKALFDNTSQEVQYNDDELDNLLNRGASEKQIKAQDLEAVDPENSTSTFGFSEVWTKDANYIESQKATNEIASDLWRSIIETRKETYRQEVVQPLGRGARVRKSVIKTANYIFDDEAISDASNGKSRSKSNTIRQADKDYEYNSLSSLESTESTNVVDTEDVIVPKTGPTVAPAIQALSGLDPNLPNPKNAPSTDLKIQSNGLPPNGQYFCKWCLLNHNTQCPLHKHNLSVRNMRRALEQDPSIADEDPLYRAFDQWDKAQIKLTPYPGPVPSADRLRLPFPNMISNPGPKDNSGAKSQAMNLKVRHYRPISAANSRLAHFNDDSHHLHPGLANVNSFGLKGRDRMPPNQYLVRPTTIRSNTIPDQNMLHSVNEYPGSRPVRPIRSTHAASVPSFMNASQSCFSGVQTMPGFNPNLATNPAVSRNHPARTFSHNNLDGLPSTTKELLLQRQLFIQNHINCSFSPTNAQPTPTSPFQFNSGEAVLLQDGTMGMANSSTYRNVHAPQPTNPTPLRPRSNASSRRSSSQFNSHPILNPYVPPHGGQQVSTFYYQTAHGIQSYTSYAPALNHPYFPPNFHSPTDPQSLHNLSQPYMNASLGSQPFMGNQVNQQVTLHGYLPQQQMNFGAAYPPNFRQVSLADYNNLSVGQQVYSPRTFAHLDLRPHLNSPKQLSSPLKPNFAQQSYDFNAASTNSNPQPMASTSTQLLPTSNHSTDSKTSLPPAINLTDPSPSQPNLPLPNAANDSSSIPKTTPLAAEPSTASAQPSLPLTNVQESSCPAQPSLPLISKPSPTPVPPSPSQPNHPIPTAQVPEDPTHPPLSTSAAIATLPTPANTTDISVTASASQLILQPSSETNITSNLP